MFTCVGLVHLFYVIKGTTCSSNGRYATTVLRLQSCARHRTRRRGCSCLFKRPAWLRIRRKTHRKICACTKNSQVKLSAQPSTIIACSPTVKCCCDNSKGYCSRGTETCFCEEDSSTGDVKCPDKTHKNICRFTVDAYFV